MGGLNSEIKEDTRVVLLESAYFNPAGNRRTAKELGLETEAAYRFGRGIDYEGCLTAANRAAQLIQELAGGKLVEGAVDVYPAPIKPNSIRLRVKRIHQVLGKEVPAKEAKAYLEGLELEVKGGDGETLVITPPSFRGDLEREIDLIEEVARMDGYEKIPVTLPQGAPSSEERNRALLLERSAMDLLIHHGFHEVITYSFTSPTSSDFLGVHPDDPRNRHLRILNPLTEDFSVLRTSLIPGLLEAARYNLSWKNLNLKLFELKKVFFPQEGEKLPKEVKYLTGLAIGLDQDPQWAFVPRSIDFYDVKGCVEDLLEVLQIKGVKFERAEDIPFLHPGKASRIFKEKEVLGILGEIHPQVLGHYEIHGRAYLFEIDFERMVKWAGEGKRFSPLPKFPAVYRDLSMVVDEDLEVAKVAEAIWMLQQPFIDEVSLFDVYLGAPIPRGKKGISYRVRYQASDRTLTDEEVNRYHEKIIFQLMEIFKAELRR
jgi:phenylalanyl-tRNA synthetase beta chain